MKGRREEAELAFVRLCSKCLQSLELGLEPEPGANKPVPASHMPGRDTVLELSLAPTKVCTSKKLESNSDQGLQLRYPGERQMF